MHWLFQIVSRKTRISRKQYNPKKPHKRSYKVITRAGTSGVVYDFDLYTGKANTIKNDSGITISSNFILKLVEEIPKYKNYNAGKTTEGRRHFKFGDNSAKEIKEVFI